MSEISIDASLTLQWWKMKRIGVTVSRFSNVCLRIVPESRGFGITRSATRSLPPTAANASLTIRPRSTWERIRKLPIDADYADPMLILTLPDLARTYELTNYDPAHLELAIRKKIPIATADGALRRAAAKAGVCVDRITGVLRRRSRE